MEKRLPYGKKGIHNKTKNKSPDNWIKFLLIKKLLKVFLINIIDIKKIKIKPIKPFSERISKYV